MVCSSNTNITTTTLLFNVLPTANMGNTFSAYCLRMEASWPTRWFLLKNHFKQLFKRFKGNSKASDISFSDCPSELWKLWEAEDAPEDRALSNFFSSPYHSSSFRFHSIPRVRRLSQRWTAEM